MAHVIQDARYQQAIFDNDVPKPEKGFPSPGRSFNVAQFVEEQNINLSSVRRCARGPLTATAQVVQEPLGRYFLSLFVPASSDEKRLLEFADQVMTLRRMDTSGVVDHADVMALCERFRLNPPAGTGGAARSQTDDTQGAAACDSD